MYRVFCESYENFIKSIENKSRRIQMAKTIELIINTEKYNISDEEELEEQTKLINSFLKLAY